jgi:hypothetical protein
VPASGSYRTPSTRNSEGNLNARAQVDLLAHPPHHPGMDRRRFLLTSLAGALAAPHAAETFSGSCQAIVP